MFDRGSNEVVTEDLAILDRHIAKNDTVKDDAVYWKPTSALAFLLEALHEVTEELESVSTRLDKLEKEKNELPSKA